VPPSGSDLNVVRVLPDVPAIDRAFDYLAADPLPVGTIVRVDLHGRRVRGWVVPGGDDAPAGVDLKPLLKVSGAGPPPEVVELARWAAWRWAGRWAHLLRTASPPANAPPPRIGEGYVDYVDATVPSFVVRRVAPGADRLPIVREAVADGPAIVVVPEIDAAARLADRLRRDGRRVALLAGEFGVRAWEAAAAGDAVVVGTRVAVWAPIPDEALRGMLVLDEHDEALQAEQAPTWHARDVAVERARRAGVPCVLVSPVPTLHALAHAGDVVADKGGWPRVEVADRRRDDRPGLFSPRLAELADGAGRVVCVLNRLGRSRLLVCTACDTTAACSVCGAAVHQPDAEVLRCSACGSERPPVCVECGGVRFKNLRMGVARAREELEVLVGEPVEEVTATTGELPDGVRVVVGTEAVLHRLRVGSAAVVAFLDLDQELLATRYRAGEQALALVARAARAVGRDGRVLLQTRLPEHPAVRAAVLGDPTRFSAAERERREALRYPPFGALAVVSGAAAEAWVGLAGDPPLGVEVLGPVDGRWLVRAPTDEALADWLAAVERPPGRLRIEVDPPRA
jgi:primosomal protein N' (replication factor Y)